MTRPPLITPALTVALLAALACSTPPERSALASPAEPAPAESAATEPAPSMAQPAGSPPAEKPKEAASQPSTPAPSAAADGAVMARVNGTPITVEEVNTAIVNYMGDHGMGPETPQERQSEIRKAVLDGLIGTELLYQRAKALSIDVPPASIDDALARTRQEMGDAAYEAELKNRKIDAGGARELVRKNLTVQKLIQETILSGVSVSEPDISKFYNEHQQEMSMPESVDVSHILVRSAPGDDAAAKAAARAKADAALARVKGGEDFAEVAKQVSDDKGSAARGGSLGEVRKGRTVPTFDDAAFKLQPGQLSDVVESPFGFHVIKVTAKHPARTLSLEESHDRIAQVLKGRASGEAVEKAVSDLRAAAKIEIY